MTAMTMRICPQIWGVAVHHCALPAGHEGPHVCDNEHAEDCDAETWFRVKR